MSAFGIGKRNNNDRLRRRADVHFIIVGLGSQTTQEGGPGGQRSGMAPSRTQQLAIAALDHSQAITHEAMRLVAESRVMPIRRAHQPLAEQSGRDFKMRCLFLPAIEASQHMAKAPALGRGQPRVGKALPVDRVDEPLDCKEAVERHVVERDDRSERFTRLLVTEKRKLRPTGRSTHVQTEVVTLVRGKRNI